MIDAIIALIDHNFATATGSSAKLKASSPKGDKRLKQITIEKLFEIVALSELLTRLKHDCPTCKFRLLYGGAPGNRLVFQSAPGLADLNKSYIRMENNSADVATIWTNVEFEGISSKSHTGSAPPTASYHEADILMISPGAHSVGTKIRPKYADVLLAIECKHLAILPKMVLRNLLGLRREMSYLTKLGNGRISIAIGAATAEFSATLPARPASHLVFCYPNHYKFDPRISWQGPADVFGLEFWPL